MTPTKQTKLYGKDGIHNGNCFAACLATLLDLPLWMVPPFEDMFGRTDHYMERCQRWLQQMLKLQLVRVEGHPQDKLPEFYIANGLSPRGVYHSVIYSAGNLVHDPHFSDAGIDPVVNWCWYLAPMDQVETEGGPIL